MVLDNFCQFVVSASRMMNLEVTKRYVDILQWPGLAQLVKYQTVEQEVASSSPG